MKTFVQVQIAFLRALHEDGNTVNNGISPIPLYEGLNSVGRNDIANSTKQVSRKHVAIAASSDRNFEIAVVCCLCTLLAQF